jgi:hypothetical protein
MKNKINKDEIKEIISLLMAATLLAATPAIVGYIIIMFTF